MSNKPKGTKMLGEVQQDVYVKQMRDRLVVLRLEHELAKLTVEKVQFEEWLMNKFPQKQMEESDNNSGDSLKTESESQDITLKVEETESGTDVDNKEA